MSDTRHAPDVLARPVRRTRLAVGLFLVAAVLVILCLLSLVIGSRAIPLGAAWQALSQADPGNVDAVVVRQLRVPRTIVGLFVGVALGLAGALMQGLARNPLADPGLLGVNAGASLAVVVAIGFLGISQPAGYVWFAFGGAAIAAVVVYSIGSMGRDGATPMTLALAGAALTALIQSAITVIQLRDVTTFDQFRFWEIGAIAGRDMDVVRQIAPFLILGVVVALSRGRMLNAMALGGDVARSLGRRVNVDRAVTAVGIVLLCGGATAMAGPIAFVGLAIPHAARLITGPDFRWILRYSALLGPVLILASDIVGRVVAQPSELQVGVVTALVGAPVLVVLVRRRRAGRP
ncbi:iron complex transport system permease protein [Nakamurella sp. UYEF19]|uniref:FecCD family ABC transporter permease n=1 Tax=Nakamurella sp. UYEF19 TaxID=1756392 RepID=UPI003395F86B